MNSLKLLALLVIVGVSLYAFTLYSASRIEQLHPPVGEFLSVDGVRMHYLDEGAGPVLVLLHGASTNLMDFKASLVEPLKRDFRVIAVDRPGYGYSGRPSGDWPSPKDQARLVRGLLKQLDVTNPLIVGHSWSGSVVLAYLLDYPEEVAGGVLLAGGTHPWQGGVAWYADLGNTPILGKLFAHTLVLPLGTLVLDAAVQRVLSPNAVPEGYVENTGSNLALRPGQFLANAEDLSRLSDFLAEQSTHYAELKPPLLMFTADEDDIVPAWNHAERLIKQAPYAQHLELDNAGHALHHAYPNLIADKIRAFALPSQP